MVISRARITRLFFLLSVVFDGLVCEIGAAENVASAIHVDRRDEGFLFREDSEKILFFQCKTKSLAGEFPRANYIHPLYDLDGNVLTEDFPKDHPHHRGVFWAWHQIRVDGMPVADSWVCRNMQWDIHEATILPGDAHSRTLLVKVHWKCPLPSDDKEDGLQPIVEETTRIRVHQRSGDTRAIDFEIRLLALVEKVSLGGSETEKGYGGFSVRLRLPEGLRFTARAAAVKPQFASLAAGPWLDFSAAFGPSEQVSGLAILCHPSLPEFPPRWILRQHGSMQNVVYPGREPTSLSQTEPTILRYRLVVHRGRAESVPLDTMQSAYEKEAIR